MVTGRTWDTVAAHARAHRRSIEVRRVHRILDADVGAGEHAKQPTWVVDLELVIPDVCVLAAVRRFAFAAIDQTRLLHECAPPPALASQSSQYTG